jgi:hypothetical protein
MAAADCSGVSLGSLVSPFSLVGAMVILVEWVMGDLLDLLDSMELSDERDEGEEVR